MFSSRILFIYLLLGGKEILERTFAFILCISVTTLLMGHMPCFDSQMKRVGPCKNFIDRVLRVQDAQLIKSEKGVGRVMPVTKGNTWIRSAGERRGSSGMFGHFTEARTYKRTCWSFRRSTLRNTAILIIRKRNVCVIFRTFTSSPKFFTVQRIKRNVWNLEMTSCVSLFTN